MPTSQLVYRWSRLRPSMSAGIQVPETGSHHSALGTDDSIIEDGDVPNGFGRAHEVVHFPRADIREPGTAHQVVPHQRHPAR